MTWRGYYVHFKFFRRNVYSSVFRMTIRNNVKFSGLLRDWNTSPLAVRSPGTVGLPLAVGLPLLNASQLPAIRTKQRSEFAAWQSPAISDVIFPLTLLYEVLALACMERKIRVKNGSVTFSLHEMRMYAVANFSLRYLKPGIDYWTSKVWGKCIRIAPPIAHHYVLIKVGLQSLVD